MAALIETPARRVPAGRHVSSWQVWINDAFAACGRKTTSQWIICRQLLRCNHWTHVHGKTQDTSSIFDISPAPTRGLLGWTLIIDITIYTITSCFQQHKSVASKHRANLRMLICLLSFIADTLGLLKVYRHKLTRSSHQSSLQGGESPV